MPTRLPPAQLLEVTGSDALAFAHAQFSSDVNALADGAWQWSAWLSAQGRVRAFFHLLRADSTRLILILRGGAGPALRAALAPYVFRSKVQLRAFEAESVVGCAGPADVLQHLDSVPQGQRFVERDGRIGVALPGQPQRWLIVTPSTLPDQDADALQRWRAADIEAGLVTLDERLVDRYLPAWLGFGQLGATSVRKGCYPGQEIVARMHFKGGNKRWLHRVQFTADALPAPGMLLEAGADTPPGDLLNAAWKGHRVGIALAVLPRLADGAILNARELPGSAFRVVSAVERAND
ncbi:MAG TPA: folate-binding protein [Rudaea sp.]|nr:folate-binding protein [Rudaea sp.]